MNIAEALALVNVVKGLGDIIAKLIKKPSSDTNDSIKKFIFPFRSVLQDCKNSIEEMEDKYDSETYTTVKFDNLLSLVLEKIVPFVENHVMELSVKELRNEILDFVEDAKKLALDTDDNLNMIAQISNEMIEGYKSIIDDLYQKTDDFVKNYNK